jgi:hypothetical protein
MARQLSGSVAGWTVIDMFDKKQVLPKETSMALKIPKAATALRFAHVGNLLQGARTTLPFILGLKAELFMGQSV